MQLKNILSFLFFLLAIGSMLAQRGWIAGDIFLNNGDTKSGLVKISLVSKDLVALGGGGAVKFKPTKKGKKAKYRPAEIDHIILNDTNYGGYYEYVAVSDKKKELFRAVVTGKAILYHRYVSMTSSTGGTNGMMMTSTYEVDEYYVKRESETIAMPLITGRISKSFRHRAKNYFSDCPSLVAKLENQTYRKRDIEKVIMVYNRCDSPKLQID